jgi:hypothetical protein
LKERVSSPENGDAWTEVMAMAAVRRAEPRVKRDILFGGRLILKIVAYVLKLKMELIDMSDGD